MQQRYRTDRAIMSLSARRAWIEIECALIRAEVNEESLSARRAWIEILNRRQFK